MQKNIQKGTKGITLIALVITLVVRYGIDLKDSNIKGWAISLNQ